MSDPSLRIGQKFAPFGYAKDQNPMVSALDPAVQATISSQNPVTQLGGATSTVTAAPATAATNDGVPPGTPSTPIVKSMISGIQVTWDGYDNNGQLMPADFARLEVHTSTTAGFTPSAATLATVLTSPTGGSAILVTGYTLTYVVFLAYDSFNNVSSPSAQASGQGSQVTGPDLAANSVTTNTIAAGAVTATQLAAGAITADKIGTGTLTVGTKITLGNTANSQSRIEIDTQASGTYGPGIRLISRDASGVDTYNVVLDNSTGVGAITSGTITGTSITGATMLSNVFATANTGTRIELGASSVRNNTGTWGVSGAGYGAAAAWYSPNADNLPATISTFLNTGTTPNSSMMVVSGPLYTAARRQPQLYLRSYTSGSPQAATEFWTDDLVVPLGQSSIIPAGTNNGHLPVVIGKTCRLDWGNWSGNTDATGVFVASHSLGVTPTIVLAMSAFTGGGPQAILGTYSYTSTQFTGRFGNISAVTACTIRYLAITTY